MHLTNSESGQCLCPRAYLGYILRIRSTLLFLDRPAPSAAGNTGVTNSEDDTRNRQHGSDIPAGRDMTLRAPFDYAQGREKPPHEHNTYASRPAEGRPGRRWSWSFGNAGVHAAGPGTGRSHRAIHGPARDLPRSRRSIAGSWMCARSTAPSRRRISSSLRSTTAIPRSIRPRFDSRSAGSSTSRSPSRWTPSVACVASSSIAGFECSGNRRPLQGLSSNARWTGVPLRTVLDQAGVKASAKEFVFFGADHGKEEVEFRTQKYEVEQQFGRSLSREKALVARADAGLRPERRAADQASGITAASARAGLVWRRQREVAVAHPSAGRPVSRQVSGALVPHAARRDDRRRSALEGIGRHAHAVEVVHRARDHATAAATKSSA